METTERKQRQRAAAYDAGARDGRVDERKQMALGVEDVRRLVYEAGVVEEQIEILQGLRQEETVHAVFMLGSTIGQQQNILHSSEATGDTRVLVQTLENVLADL
jgi:hypothetical protein